MFCQIFCPSSKKHGPVVISPEQWVSHVEQISRCWLVGRLHLIKWGHRARRAPSFHTIVTLTKGTCLAGNNDTFINGRVCVPALAQTPDWLPPPGPLSLFHIQEPIPSSLGYQSSQVLCAPFGLPSVPVMRREIYFLCFLWRGLNRRRIVPRQIFIKAAEEAGNLLLRNNVKCLWSHWLKTN